MEGAGCTHCLHTGYYGRTGIFEILLLDDEVRRLVTEQTPAGVIKQHAVSSGLRTLRMDGVEKARRGITSVSEVFRVTQTA